MPDTGVEIGSENPLREFVLPFKPNVRHALTQIVGDQWVKDDPVSLYAYRCDGLTLHPSMPMGIVFPATTQALAEVVKLLAAHDISFLPRGAGTGLSGGAIPQNQSVLIEMFRFNAIKDIDPLERTITVGPGVVNITVSQAASPHGLYFAPDPSSQKACTIGGNVGENSGGPHTLKYGVTVNHVLGLEMVLPDGEIVRIGGSSWQAPGPDLLALTIGSEGTFGIVTEVTCRLTPIPPKTITMLAVFADIGDASRAVSAIIGAGMVPAALEMIDKVVIGAVEKTIKPGFPTDAEAVLILELDGLEDGLEEEARAIEGLCQEQGATRVSRAHNEDERAIIWRARKEALGAIGAISPSFYTQDGVIPRSALPAVLEQMIEIGARHGLTVANVFHAGDGNLHPLILYDSTKPEQVAAVEKAGVEILQACLDVGGTLSGEHGIGLEKSDMMARIFTEADLENMIRVRSVFNPHNLLNPGKIFPTPGACAEMRNGPLRPGVQV